MVTQFDMTTGEIVSAAQIDSVLGDDTQDTLAPALHLLTVDEATLMQDGVRHVPGMLLTQLE